MFTIAIIYSDDIFINNCSKMNKNERVYDIKLYEEIKQLSKNKFEELLRKCNTILIDSRLVDVICTISYYASMKEYNLELLILDTEKYNTIYTFYQYMKLYWFKNQFRLFDDKQLSNVFATILILNKLNSQYRVDLICDVVSNSNIIAGKYNIEILISFVEHNLKLLQTLLKQRDFNIHLDYHHVKKLVEECY